MITLFENKNECCGCSACQAVCPTNAIEMVNDEYGFPYPNINEVKCIECGLCVKTCSFKSKRDSEKKPIRTYVAINKSDEMLMNSSSGGVFGAVASGILDNHGVVFGCAINENSEAKHIFITKQKDLRALQGSKYIQSDMGNSFKVVKEFLDSNKQVFFSGTPCQVDGLKSYLKRDYDNLLTADIICHGVPSPKFFKDYMDYMGKKEKANVVDFKFRDKTVSPMSCAGKISYAHGNKTYIKKLTYNLDCFYSYFMYGVISRDSCYNCLYASGDRPGDITMGDYWGVENYHPEVMTNKGVSALLVNSKKGMELDIEKDLKIIDANFENVLKHNSNLEYPTPIHKDREMVLKIYIANGIEAVVENFRKKLGIKYYYYKFKTMIPNSAKRKIKQLLLKR